MIAAKSVDMMKCRQRAAERSVLPRSPGVCISIPEECIESFKEQCFIIAGLPNSIKS